MSRTMIRPQTRAEKNISSCTGCKYEYQDCYTFTDIKCPDGAYIIVNDVEFNQMAKQLELLERLLQVNYEKIQQPKENKMNRLKEIAEKVHELQEQIDYLTIEYQDLVKPCINKQCRWHVEYTDSHCITDEFITECDDYKC